MMAWLLALSVAAAEPSLQQVLARAAAYVASFERELAGLVGDEHYVQEVKGVNTGDGNLTTPTRTELRSHLLLVRNGRSGYVQYRDVYEVDGRAIGDRGEHFSRLFDGSATADERKRRMLEDSARFNIGDIMRTSNLPLLALEFLSAANQWRFSFKRSSNVQAPIGDAGETPPATFRVSTDVWVLQYQEREPGTIIRNVRGRDIKSRGRLWVEVQTGRVLMTELTTDDHDVASSTVVSFKSEPLRGLLVPVEMRERYRGRKGSAIEAIATYGRFAPFKLE
jgi:hypothetical protein